MIVLSIISAAYFIICIDSRKKFKIELGFGLPTRSNNESCLEWISKSVKNMERFTVYGCSNINFYNQISLSILCAIAVVLCILELLLLLPFMIKCVGFANNDFFRGVLIIATSIPAFGVAGDLGICGGALGIIFGIVWMFAGALKSFECCVVSSTKVDPVDQK
jgi:hypothetical protein